MRAVRYGRNDQVSFNMTPMIDIVFLLIIFFLLSSHLVRRESQLEIPLPAATTGEDEWDETRPRVTLNVLSDGEVLLSGRAIAISQLSSRLAWARQEMTDDLEVRIRADRTVPYEFVSPILVAAAKA
ncbi:MAG: biopolymer transporter ExbD, partial [Planctomycetales bacterium]|nr:biopolymer transporter ExbD [Planctomycetales bacterium]